MKDATAQQGGMTASELAAWVADLRKQQGLPPTVENSTALERVATLLRHPGLGSPT